MDASSVATKFYDFSLNSTWPPNPVQYRVTPVGRLVGATAQVDGELGDMRVRARKHWQQLHEVHRPNMAFSTTM